MPPSLLPLRAVASVGTGVGASPIVLSELAQPGHSYTLPQLYVFNTGTEASQYRVHVSRLEEGAQHDVPSGWVDLPTSPIASPQVSRPRCRCVSWCQPAQRRGIT